MKAIIIVPGDKGGTLELRDVPEPKPQPAVRASDLTRARARRMPRTG